MNARTACFRLLTVAAAAIALLTVSTPSRSAQIDIVAGEPEVIDLRKVLPGNDSAVTSMITLADGRIAGVGSGRNSINVFAIQPATKAVEKLASISVPAPYWSHPTLAANDTMLFVAVSFDPYALHKWAKEEGHVKGKTRVASEKLVAPFLYMLDLKTKKITGIESPVAGTGAIGLTLDARRGALYALSVPPLFDSGSHLISADLKTKKTADLGVVSKTASDFYDHQVPCQAMALDRAGNILMTGNGSLKRCLAKTGKIDELAAKIPAVPGRHAFSYIESMVIGPGGGWWGGTSEGYLFRLDAKAATIENFGKALRQAHVIDLVVGNGLLYGVGGEEDGLPRLFSFDPEARTFTLGCTPQANGPGAFGRIGALAFADGKLWVAEKERNARIFIFSPQAEE